MSTVIQRSFAGGEISPSLHSRVDTVKYTTGLKTCRNFMVMRHGGATNRPGTAYVANMDTSSKHNAVRMIPFVFNSDQTYVLVFGDQQIKVIRRGVLLADSTKTITGATKANPCVITSNAHGFSNGDEVTITGVYGMPELNNRQFIIANVAANTFELKTQSGVNVDSSSFGTYTSGGSAARTYIISSPYVYPDYLSLKFVQSADVITLVHPSYAPRTLSRSGHTSWTLSTITFAPALSAPTGVSNSGAAGTTTYWVVTSFSSETGEESLASSSTSSSATPSSGSPITVSWTGASGASSYNVYKALNGIYGFIGIAVGTSFVDTGYTADTTDSPPSARNPFGSSGNYPSTVSYFQQRLSFGNTNNYPEKVWESRSGNFYNFTTSTPSQDDDAITFSLAGRQVNSVKHLVELARPVVMTSSGEWVLGGDGSGVLRPTAINPQQQSYYGSSDLIPIVIGASALFVQARSSSVRDLSYDYQIDGYHGNDLTLFANHLFDGYTLSDWAYQQIPHSTVWVARDDGALLGLTYVREQQIFAWHRHDFQDRLVESVCCVPEGDEDFLYLAIHDPNASDYNTSRFVERLSTRFIEEANIKDAKFLDASLSYDGRYTDGTEITISGSGWTHDDTLTITASASIFLSSDVGNEIHVTDSNGEVYRLSLTAYSSSTIMSARPNRTIPAELRSVATTNFAKAVDTLSGLWHLEGKDVSVFGDGFVVANPNNDAYDIVTVSSGSITLDRCYSVIHVGLPYTSDLETLSVDTAQGETIVDKKSIISRVTMHVENTRGLFVGPSNPGDESQTGLYEVKVRNTEGYDSPVSLQTGTVEVNIRPEWVSNGRIFVRQTDPVPATILSIAPAGLFPFNGRSA